VMFVAITTSNAPWLDSDGAVGFFATAMVLIYEKFLVRLAQGREANPSSRTFH